MLENYLYRLRDEVFKLLPLKEASLRGVNNHVEIYLETLSDATKGALGVYPELSKEKKFLYVVNSLRYILDEKPPLKKWRRVVLNSTRNLSDLLRVYSEGHGYDRE